MKISVLGMGYVGCVSAACFAEMGHQVIGVDINPNKVEKLKLGKSPIVENGLETLLGKHIDKNFTATQHIDESVLKSDVIFICVGTPTENGNVDLTALKRVCSDIADCLKNKKEYTSIVIRSTVLPNLLVDEIVPILEKNSCKRIGIDFGFAVNPEFLREGSAVYDFLNPPKIVIGGDDEQTVTKLIDLYKPIDAPIFNVTINESCLLKYFDNAFHALKIVFANDVGRVCKNFGVDSRKIMDIFVQDNKLNLSSTYLKPGMAYGGSCLPKDVDVLSGLLDNDNIFQATRKSNDAHLTHAVEMIKNTGEKRIGFLGASFKAGTDDLRNSPTIFMVKKLLAKSFNILIFDEHIDFDHLIGSNKNFLEQNLPDYRQYFVNSIDECINSSRVIVVMNKSDFYKNKLEKSGKKILDFAGLFDLKSGEEEYEGICW